MQWIINHELELRLVVIYIGYWSVVDFLQQDVESISKLDSEGDKTLMSLISPCFELIYHVGTIYEGWIDSRFTFVHKVVLVIMQSCTSNSE